MKKPIIKANGGKPIALCNRCFCIMCYLACSENHEMEDDGDSCVVIEIRSLDDKDYISTPIGKRPPSYCDECTKLLRVYLN